MSIPSRLTMWYMYQQAHCHPAGLLESIYLIVTICIFALFGWFGKVGLAI
jgi:hypothetical protein